MERFLRRAWIVIMMFSTSHSKEGPDISTKHVKVDTKQKLETVVLLYFFEWSKKFASRTKASGHVFSVWLVEEGVVTVTHPRKNGCQRTDSKNEKQDFTYGQSHIVCNQPVRSRNTQTREDEKRHKNITKQKHMAIPTIMLLKHLWKRSAFALKS